MAVAAPELRIDRDRLTGRIRALAEIGATGDGGCARLALTDDDRRGRDLVLSWMEDLGLDVRTDRMGNVIAERRGREDLAPVMTGSHIDTVRTGGRYDGNLGVLAGLEVIETLERTGTPTRRPVAVGFFTNEEGSRFAPDMMGSMSYLGDLPIEVGLDTVGIDGARVRDELERIGYLGSYPCPGPTPHAFVELHIEQGPVLESEGKLIGAVTGVQGISWQEFTIAGQSNHAGTTPMSLRRDAGHAAMALGTAVRRIATELGPPQVGTVGSLTLHPNLVNVVAAGATMTVDLRNTDEARLQQAERRLAEAVSSIGADDDVEISSRSLARFEPVTFDPRIVDLVANTAADLGHSVHRLPAGAGHDAGIFAGHCPAGMVFVPSVGGVSHNPAEFTADEDLEAGANVLLQVLLTLADEPEPTAAAGRGRRRESVR